MPLDSPPPTESVSTLDRIREIKRAALEMKGSLERLGPEYAERAKEPIADLADQFYELNKDLMAPQQYEAMKGDLDYFLNMVETAIAHYEFEEGTAENHTAQ